VNEDEDELEREDLWGIGGDANGEGDFDGDTDGDGEGNPETQAGLQSRNCFL
jgi:hypothetical protein